MYLVQWNCSVCVFTLSTGAAMLLATERLFSVFFTLGFFVVMFEDHTDVFEESVLV